jgi:hypothetical protein
MKLLILAGVLLFSSQVFAKKIELFHDCRVQGDDFICYITGNQMPPVEYKSLFALTLFAKYVYVEEIDNIVVIFSDGWFFSILRTKIIACMNLESEGEAISQCVLKYTDGGKLS